jgi:hypothetical protein
VQPAAKEFAGGAVFLGDVETTFALLNHGRRVAIARLFGVEGRDADIVTLIGLALLIQSARAQARRLGGTPLPSGADAFLGFAAAREAIMGIAGPITRETPGVPAFIMIAVLGAAAGPTLAKTLQRVRSGTQRVNTGFHHRYGYLVDPGHRRQRRADRRDRAVSTAVPANRQPSR